MFLFTSFSRCRLKSSRAENRADESLAVINRKRKKKEVKKLAVKKLAVCLRSGRASGESGRCEWQVAQRGHIVLSHSFRRQRLEMTAAPAFHFTSREEDGERTRPSQLFKLDAPRLGRRI